MKSIGGIVAIATALLTPALAQPVEEMASTNFHTASSLTLLYQKNVNETDDIKPARAVPLDPIPASSAAIACASMNGKLLPKSVLQAHLSDFKHSLYHQSYSRMVLPIQAYYIQDGVAIVNADGGQITFKSMPAIHESHPFLCTQLANPSTPSETAAPGTQINVSAGDNMFVGFRNKTSFRFLGIPNAVPSERFVYSHLFPGKGQTT